MKQRRKAARKPIKTAYKLASVRSTNRPNRSAFLLILVLVVIAMASFAALSFAKSMMLAHSSSRFSNARLQARMAAESGLQSVRLFLAAPRMQREEMGGTWDNAAMFQALNVIPDNDPSRRGNFTVISPSLDTFGSYSGIRFAPQNESAKLNLNTLVQLDALAASGDLGSAAVGGGDEASTDPTSALMSGLASEMTSDVASTMAVDILMALPGMTEEIAEAILDFIDEDEEARLNGAEFEDYYVDLPAPYKPPNKSLNSIEQLLLVRGITPQLLFGYDENRNGLLDQGEMNKMNMGVQPGAIPGSLSTAVSSDPNVEPPPPLGWAAYLTLHSEEKNVASDGYERININSDDLETLYADLSDVLGNDAWASFIIAFRMAGQAGGNGSSPLVTLAQMAAEDSEQTDGALGAQLDTLSSATSNGGPDTSNAEPWTADLLSSFDLSQGGSVQFNQVLDLFDAVVTVPGEGGGNGQTYLSPLTSDPLIIANATPLLMNYLTTVDGEAIPGRINIMRCPAEILRGIPGLDDETVDDILEAREDGSDSESRQYETWLAAEGYVTMDEMRALLPLITCGGDVFKCQVIGYMEGEAAFSRVEAIISAAGDVPEIKFFRRLDHLGRGFDTVTLGQRFDAGANGITQSRQPGMAPTTGGFPGAAGTGGFQ